MLTAVRVLHFWALAIVFGGAGLLLALGRQPPPGSRAMLRIAAAATSATGAAWFVLVFADVGGGPEALTDPAAWAAFTAAPFGTPWLVRLALCAAAASLVRGRAPLRFVLLGGALIVDQAWLGHAADGPAAGLVFYWLHVGAGLAWVGALAMLCRVAIAERRVPADAMALFSRFGVALIAALLAGALVETAMRGVTPGSLATTPYGRILVGKGAGLAAMLALALHHRSGAARSGTIPATLPAETLLGLGVLALAAALGVASPA